MDESDKSFHAPERSVKGDLIEILDYNVIVVGAEVPLEIATGEKCVGVAIAHTVDFDPVEIHSRRSAVPRAAEEVDLVPARNYAREDFPQMKLGSAGLRIQVILPVEDEYPH
jgi:hypothetical protein